MNEATEKKLKLIKQAKERKRTGRRNLEMEMIRDQLNWLANRVVFFGLPSVFMLLLGWWQPALFPCFMPFLAIGLICTGVFAFMGLLTWLELWL